MNTKNSSLSNLSDSKLIDVVKNYRQYGYSETIRKEAIEILNERGIDKEQLELTGNFENTTYNDSERLYHEFMKNSKIAFILYGALFILMLLNNLLSNNNELISLIISISNWIILVSYIIYSIKSYNNQDHFYKTIGAKENAEGVLGYFSLGMPLFIFMYFHYKKNMKEKMSFIQ